MMRKNEAVRLFCLNNLAIESDIRRIEFEYDIDLGHKDRSREKIDETFYPQFSEKIRKEANSMAANYVIFYCLENSIREFIAERLSDPSEFGPNWWEKAVPKNVKDNSQKNREREITAGITPRSTEPIDYSNFGELGEIIKINWDIFGDTLRDVKAVERVLAEDEVLRLHLGLRDWFRQME